MELTLTEDQTMLGEAVERLVREQHDFAARRAAIESDAGWIKDFWHQLAELGILGAAIPEEFGGLGGGAIMTMLVMQSFGKGLVIAPYVPTIVCAAGLIARAGSPEQRNEHLPAILDGSRIFAFACSERNDQGDLGRLRTTAARDGNSYRINGEKSLVIGASWAEWIIVVARLTGASEEAAVGAFILPAQAKGISVRSHRTIDGWSASEIQFDNVIVDPGAMIGTAEGGYALIEQIIDDATAALCAEAGGAIDALLSATVSYAKTRKQFGQPIGKFQVLQHRMVDMLIARDQAISISHLACVNLNAEPRIRQKAVSAAKAHIGTIGRRAAQAAVQIHGGIGITDELDVSHYFRRLEVINIQFGSVDHHIQRYAELQNHT